MAGEVVPAAHLPTYNSAFYAKGTVTFNAGVGQGVAGDPVCFLTLPSGIVLLRELIVYCSLDLACAAGTLISLGTEGLVTQFIAATDATAIDANTYWHSTTPTAIGAATPSACRNFPLANASGASGIYATVSVHNITGGTITMYALYDAVVAGSALVPGPIAT